MSLFDSGSHETLKGDVHAALGALALLCVGYNAIAFCKRGEPHLAVNVALYGALAAYELEMVAHHRRGVRQA